MKAGHNIALKVPGFRFEETVAFYRDRVGLPVKRSTETNVAFTFGAMTLWVDCVEHQSQSDVWLELLSEDPDADVAMLGSPLRDALEPLDEVDGHWTSDPAGTVLLVRKPTA